MSPNDPDTDGWDEYQKLILFRLDKLRSQIDEIEDCLDEVQKENIASRIRWHVTTFIATTLTVAVIGALAKGAI
jgi:NH3-dependent NAD+ synthetase